MKRLLVVALLALSTTALALDDSPTNRESQAERYLAAAPPGEMFKDAAEQMSQSFEPSQRQKFKDLMTKHLDIAALTKAMKQALVKHFSADELKALADFYGSEVGKSAMKKFGVYLADVMPSIQTEMMKAQSKASQELTGAKE